MLFQRPRLLVPLIKLLISVRDNAVDVAIGPSTDAVTEPLFVSVFDPAESAVTLD